MSTQSSWTPYSSLTQAPTNLKEAIDWVLRVTGRDGKKNEKPTAAKAPPAKPEPGPHCLCYLAKAVKDLLYDAKDPGTPGPSPKRYWDNILLPGEQSIVHPVLTDLGLVNSDSTSVSGGTEVIRTLIDQLAQGLQKWVGWQEGDICCLMGEKKRDNGARESKGIGKKCEHGAAAPDGSGKCCNSGTTGATASGTPCASHECNHCGVSPACETCNNDKRKCYQSAYQKNTIPKTATDGQYYWPTISSDPDKVHLLARIFLGSVCLIWSGLSQLGFLTGDNRWSKSTLHEIEGPTAGLGSFMAAMGYDLERLNQGKGTGKNGTEVAKMLIESIKDLKEGTNQGSVAEYYSSICNKAKTAVDGKIKTEQICEQYPLLVLHILASGYFRAGSAGANKVTPAKPASSTTGSNTTTETTKKDNTPRKPRTIREILYWLSALPYSEKYRELVERMQGKMKEKGDTIQLYDEKSDKTDLKKCCIPYYLMAACGYCPLVLIGIQGTIEREVKPDTGPEKAEKCPKHKEKRNHICDPNEIDKTAAAAAPDGELKEGQVCYRGYHLAVKDFGPLHGMYANGLYGFEMDISSAQCLDQLRIYVYHCFYQLYFLRKQCGVGVESGGGAGVKTVLGWQSCRYGSGVRWSATTWLCSTGTQGNGAVQDCKCKKSATPTSPLMAFLCDSLRHLHCPTTTASSNSETNPYPPIQDHFEDKETVGPGHFGKPPMHCPVPMGWQAESGISNNSGKERENHFKDLSNGTHKQADLEKGQSTTYPAHCTGRTLSHLLEYYCDPKQCHGSLVVLLRLLACITPTVPRTLGDLFGFYYYIVYIGGKERSWEWKGEGEVRKQLESVVEQYGLGMVKKDDANGVMNALVGWSGVSTQSNGSREGNHESLMRLFSTYSGHYLTPLSGQQYGQLSPLMAGTYLSWLVYLIGEFQGGLEGLETAFKGIGCTEAECKGKGGVGGGCGGDKCVKGNHGDTNNCCGCASVVSCTGVLPVLYKYGFGYGDVSKLHDTKSTQKKCHDFLETLKGVLGGEHLKKDGSGLHYEINKLIYTTRLPWIFVLTLAWLVAVLYLAFGAIWPLDWAHMRSHCRGWFRKGSLSPWEILMVGKKKGRGILEFFGGK